MAKRNPREAWHQVHEDAEQLEEDFVEAVEDSAYYAKEKAQQGAQKAGEAVKHRVVQDAQAAWHYGSAAKDTASVKASSVANRAKASATSLMSSASGRVKSAKEAEQSRMSSRAAAASRRASRFASEAEASIASKASQLSRDGQSAAADFGAATSNVKHTITSKTDQIKSTASLAAKHAKASGAAAVHDAEQDSKAKLNDIQSRGANVLSRLFEQFSGDVNGLLGGFKRTGGEGVDNAKSTLSKASASVTSFVPNATDSAKSAARAATISGFAPTPSANDWFKLRSTYDKEKARANSPVGWADWIKGAVLGQADQIAQEVSPSYAAQQQHWFGWRKPTVGDKFTALYEDMSAAKDRALQRGSEITQKIAELPEDAREEAYAVRKEIAQWLDKARRTGNDVANKAVEEFDRAVEDVEDIWDDFLEGWRQGDRHQRGSAVLDDIKRKVSDAVYEVEKKVSGGASWDKDLRHEFDQIAAKGGRDMRKLYDNTREETLGAVGGGRRAAIRKVKANWEAALKEVRAKYVQAENLEKKARAATGEKAEEVKVEAERVFQEAEDDVAVAFDRVIKEGKQIVRDAEHQSSRIWWLANEQVSRAAGSWDIAKDQLGVQMENLRDSLSPDKEAVRDAYAHLKDDVAHKIDHVKSKTPLLGVLRKSDGSFGLSLPGLREGPGEGEPVAPLATLYGALFALYFCYMGWRVWKERKAAKVWVGDGTLEQLKVLYGTGAGQGAIVTEVETTSGKRDGRSARADSAFGNDEVEKTERKSRSTKTTVTTAPTTTASSLHSIRGQTALLANLQRLQHAQHELNQFVWIVPFMLALLTALELNGYDPTIVHGLYVGLIISGLLATETGQRLCADLGAGRDLAYKVFLAVALSSVLLTGWGALLGEGGLPGLPVKVVGGGHTIDQ